MFKIEGLDKLQRQLSDVQKAFGDLDGMLTELTFDPSDPASIEAAIKKGNLVIEERVGNYPPNPLIDQAAEAMNEQIRTAVIERAQAARLEQGREK